MRYVIEITSLQAHRRMHGLTQRALAQALGVTQPYVAAVESGGRSPGPSFRRAAAAFLGVPEQELFPASAASSPPSDDLHAAGCWPAPGTPTPLGGEV